MDLSIIWIYDAIIIRFYKLSLDSLLQLFRFYLSPTCTMLMVGMHAIPNDWFICMHCYICTAHCCTFFVLRLKLYGHYFLKNLSICKYGNNQFRSINFMLNIVHMRALVITFRQQYVNIRIDGQISWFWLIMYPQNK